MGKLKIVELVLLAISALVSAAKGIAKFIDYTVKLRNRPAIKTA